MATLLSETQWDVDADGSPAPQPVFSAVYDTQVASPYYRDGRDVPVTDYINSSASLSTLAPAATIITPGPSLVVVGDLDGLWPQGTVLNVAITVTGGTNISTSITQTAAATLLSTDAAVRVANFLNANYGTEILAAHTGDGNVTISALAGVTALTITTWAVA